MSSFQPQESGAPTLCAAGCGLFGSPATHDMCSVCYKKHHCTATAGPGASSTATASEPVARPACAASVVIPGSAKPAAVAFASSSAQPSRCAACYKRVGLTGFVCRCAKTFCGRHRYAEEHGCAFDFKAAGRDTIARANPLIKGEKLSCRI